MSSMKDLLGDEPFTYPQQPGWRDPVTSREAANKVASKAATLRDQVLELLSNQTLTVHEAATILDCTVPSIQPRFSELVAMEKIEWTGERRKNASGMSAKVWKLA